MSDFGHSGGSSGGGGGAPTGAAGGDLSGTYPNPTVATQNGHTIVTTSDTGTVTSAMIADATIVTGDLSATAGITSGQLAGSIAPSKITGTAVTAADTGTVTSAMLADGTIVNADVATAAAIAVTKLAAGTDTQVLTTSGSTVGWAAAAGGAPSGTAGGDLSGTYPNPGVAKLNGVAAASYALLAGPTLTGTPAAPTAAVNTNTTQLATTAFVVAQANAQEGFFMVGANSYANMPIMAAATASSVAAGGDGRWVRVVMSKSGTLHDVSFLTATTGNNYNILVLDDGQANATHTTRTCLAIKGATATPAGGTWITLDPAIAVNAGDTLVFMWTGSTTTPQMLSATGGTGAGLLPTTSFFPGSGASTANQKVSGTCASANVPAAVNGTVTDANMVAAANSPLVVWRIT